MTMGDMERLVPTMDNKARLLALLVAIFAAAAMRLVPHPPNFSPIAAMALVSGAYLPRKALSFAAPFGALLLSDAILGFYAGMGFVYASFALTILIGWLLSLRKTPFRIGAAAVASSVLFFAVTNFGMWLFSGLYPRTADGLFACYLAAIPFFQNTLAGDLIYAGVLFGLLSLVPAAQRPGRVAQA